MSIENFNYSKPMHSSLHDDTGTMLNDLGSMRCLLLSYALVASIDISISVIIQFGIISYIPK